MSSSQLINDDAPALNADGTLKDPSEIVWFNLPSDTHPINFDLTSEAAIPAPDFTVGESRPRRARRPTEKAAAAAESSSENESPIAGPSVRKRSPAPAAKRGGKRAAQPARARVRTASSASDRLKKSLIQLQRKASNLRRTERSIPNLAFSTGQKRARDFGATTEEDFKDPSSVFDGPSSDAEDDAEEDELDSDEDVIREFKKTKLMADNDRQFSKRVGGSRKSDKTNDVRLIFKEHVRTNPDTGAPQKGHICDGCCLRKQPSFMTGNVTTQRMHIKRYHWKLYEERCNSAQVSVNPRCVPDNVQDKVATQGTLDVFAQAIPRWTKDGLREHILHLCVAEDNAFLLVDRPAFRQLLQYMRPMTLDSDIPHHQWVRDEVLEKANKFLDKLTDIFENTPGKVSFTFDTWTSRSRDPYMAITSHYIDSLQTYTWELRTNLIGFIPIVGDHSGLNQARHILKCVDRLGLRSKMGWFMSDNATNNDTAMNGLENPSTLTDDDSDGPRYDLIPDGEYPGSKRRVQCGSHIINLAAKHFLQAVSSERNNRAPAEEDNNDDDDDLNNIIKKLNALVNQIRASPQATSFFLDCCDCTKTPRLHLVQWVATRWSSMYNMLERVILLHNAIDLFTAMADQTPRVPKLRARRYVNYTITNDEWTRIELIHDVLLEPHSAQHAFSAEQHHSVYRTYPILKFMTRHWTNMAGMPRFLALRGAIDAGLASLRKFHTLAGKLDANVMCLVLNPTIKFRYIMRNWSSEDQTAARTTVRKVFDSYFTTPEARSNEISASAVSEVLPKKHRG